MGEKRTTLILLAVTLVFVVLGILLLPAQVVIQVGSDGQPSSIVPKAVGILIPAGISVFGVCMRYFAGEAYKRKGFITTIVGFVAAILCLIFNL